MGRGTTKIVRCPPFQVDLANEQLTRDGTPVPLRPKTWSVLRHLVEHPGELVTKDALFDAVWPDTAVTEATLSRSIRELREALADDARTPQFVETVHRRGFRFIGPIEDGAVAAPGDQPHVPTTTLVGRTDALGTLDRRLSQAIEGQRQVVFVTGEPGIGKTALVDAFLTGLGARVGDRPVWLAHGHCVEQHGEGEPYLPFLAAFEQLGRGERRDEFLPLLRRHAPTWLAQMPWLLPEGESAALQAVLASGTRARMLREFGAAAHALAATGTVFVLVAEDLQWSDPSTIDLIASLAQGREPLPLLLLGTYRPVDAIVSEHRLVEARQRLRTARLCEELALELLDVEAVHALLAERFPGCEIPRAVATRLHAHTDGNPLFLTVIVEHLADDATLAVNGSTLTLGTFEDRDLPLSIREMIEARLRALAADDQALLAAAAVAGMKFRSRAVAAALATADEATDAALATIARHGEFLRPRAPDDGQDTPGGYRFVHALHRRVAYDLVPPLRRQQFHQRIGESLETDYAGRSTEVAAELAAHFADSKDVPRALRYMTDAAEHAQRRFASREAVIHLRKALELSATTPDQEERASRELDLRFALGENLVALVGYADDAVADCFHQTSELARTTRNVGRQFASLYALWLHKALRNDAHAPEAARSLLRFAADTGDAAMRASAEREYGYTQIFAGEHEKGCRLLTRALTFHEGPKGPAAPTIVGEEPSILGRLYLAHGYWYRGDLDRARTSLTEGLARITDQTHPVGRTLGWSYASLVGVCLGDAAAALRLADAAGALGREYDLALAVANADILGGAALLALGEVDDARSRLRRGRDARHAIGVRLYDGFVRAHLGLASLAAGDLTDDGQPVEDLLTPAAHGVDRQYDAELHRVRAEVLAARGAGGQAVQDALDRADETARAQSARTLELRAAGSRVRLATTAATRRRAIAGLRRVYDGFTEGLDSAELQTARALLDGT